MYTQQKKRNSCLQRVKAHDHHFWCFLSPMYICNVQTEILHMHKNVSLQVHTTIMKEFMFEWVFTAKQKYSVREYKKLFYTHWWWRVFMCVFVVCAKRRSIGEGIWTSFQCMKYMGSLSSSCRYDCDRFGWNGIALKYFFLFYIKNSCASFAALIIFCVYFFRFVVLCFLFNNFFFTTRLCFFFPSTVYFVCVCVVYCKRHNFVFFCFCVHHLSTPCAY